LRDVPSGPKTPEQLIFFKQELHDRATSVLKRTLKLINGQLDELIQKKGCDASNMFDEEVLPTEQEFSDDEEEKEAKRQRKLLLRRRRDQ